MITLKDVENFVKKFPELELIHKKDCYEKRHYYCVMKESPNFIVFEFHNHNDDDYIYLYTDIPFRVDCEKDLIYHHNVDTLPYGCAYFDLNKMEKPLKRVVFMLDNLILVQKKMKLYEKKLDVEKDFQ